MTTKTKTPRQQARAIAGVLDGHAPAELAFAVTDLIEIAIEDAAAEAGGERDEARAEVERLTAEVERLRRNRADMLTTVEILLEIVRDCSPGSGVAIDRAIAELEAGHTEKSAASATEHPDAKPERPRPHCLRSECECSDFDVSPDMGAK